MDSSRYKIYACLPFVELGHGSAIEMGPLLFWPSSRHADFLAPELNDSFSEYFDSIGRIKAQIADNDKMEISYVDTIKLTPQVATCISVREDVEPEKIHGLIIDALHLLYYACTFRNLYFNDEIPPFRPFTKIIPADAAFLQNKTVWSEAYIFEHKREETVCIHLVDQEICHAFGIALDESLKSDNPARQEDLKRLVRSIRYFGDRFFEKFVNLLGIGFKFSPHLFEPEDILFIASSFDTLLNIAEKYPSSDFKEKVRPMLHLKYNEPIEIFWKWVDQFYQIRRQLIHTGDLPDEIFTSNPSFRVSFVYLGIKLYIYTVYYTLFKLKLLPSDTPTFFNPPTFKWIHPEEVLLFFWTEEGVLNKLSVLFLQLDFSPNPLEVCSEIILFTHMYSATLRLYGKNMGTYPGQAVHFNPVPRDKIIGPLSTIIEHATREIIINGNKTSLIELLPPDFLNLIQKRLKVEEQ